MFTLNLENKTNLFILKTQSLSTYISNYVFHQGWCIRDKSWDIPAIVSGKPNIYTSFWY